MIYLARDFLETEAIVLFLVRDGVVELEDVAFFAFQFGFLELDGGARVLVQHAGEQIRQVITPQQFRAHRFDVVLHAVEHAILLNDVFRIKANVLYYFISFWSFFHFVPL